MRHAYAYVCAALVPLMAVSLPLHGLKLDNLLPKSWADQSKHILAELKKKQSDGSSGRSVGGLSISRSSRQAPSSSLPEVASLENFLPSFPLVWSCNGQCYVATTQAGGAGLWKLESDNTLTELLNPDYAGAGLNSGGLVFSCGSDCYFMAYGDGNNNSVNGTGLWKIEGDALIMLFDPAYAGAGLNQGGPVFSCGSDCYFMAYGDGNNNSVNGTGLWKLEGDALTMLFDPAYAGAGFDRGGAVFSCGSDCYFTASGYAFNNGVNGTGLWKIEGDNTLTELLNPDYAGAGLNQGGTVFSCGSDCYFTAHGDAFNNGVNGTGLWKIEGDALTMLFDPAYAGAGFDQGGTVVSCGSDCYFIAYGNSNGVNATGLWKIESNNTLTELFDPAHAGAGFNRGGTVFSCGSDCYFTASGGDNGVNATGLWKIESNNTLTVLFDPAHAGAGFNQQGILTVSGVFSIVSCGSDCYFTAAGDSSGVNATGLWKIEGDTLTVLLDPVYEGAGLAGGSVFSCGSDCYFFAISDTTFSLWKINSVSMVLEPVLFVEDLSFLNLFSLYLQALYNTFTQNQVFLASAGLNTLETCPCYLPRVLADPYSTTGYRLVLYSLAGFSVACPSDTTITVDDYSFDLNTYVYDNIVVSGAQGYPSLVIDDGGFNVAAPGTYIVTVTATDGAYQTAACSFTVTVAAEQTMPTYPEVYPEGYQESYPEQPLVASCLCKMIGAAAASGNFTLAAQLYCHASEADRTCLCSLLSADAMAGVLMGASRLCPDATLLPSCVCDSALHDRWVQVLTTIILSNTTTLALVEKIVREVVTNSYATTACCSVVSDLLVSLVLGDASAATLCTVVSTAMSAGCSTQIICDWFVSMIQNPLLGENAAATVLAQLLATGTSYCDVGQTVLTTLCCQCDAVDVSGVIASAMITLQNIFGGSLPTLGCN